MKRVVLCVSLCCSLGCFSQSQENEFEEFDAFGRPIEVRPAYLPVYNTRQVRASTPSGAEDLQPLQDGVTVVASDTSTSALYFADLSENAVKKVSFDSAPSRLAVSKDAVFAVLRDTGSVARVGLLERSIEAQRSVCPAPRGISHDPARGRVWVACASGELAALDPETMEVVTTYHVDADLRDVVATPQGIYVSRFRAAEILRIDPNSGAISQRVALPTSQGTGASSNTAWRMAPGAHGLSLLVSYQESSDQEIPLVEEDFGEGSSYGGGSPFDAPPSTCSQGIVSSISAEVEIDEVGEMTAPPTATCLAPTPLPVDIDANACGHVVLRGSEVPSFTEFQTSASSCDDILTGASHLHKDRTPLAATTLPSGDYVIAHRGENLQLRVATRAGESRDLMLSTTAPMHLGQRLFHATTSAGIACASCHPDAGDDGHIWRFERIHEDNRDLGHAGNVAFVRRTQNLRGGIEGKLHWDGEFEDITSLMSDVFSQRMGGFTMHSSDGEAIKDWLNALQPQSGMTLAPTEALAVDHGKDLYESAEVGCTNCHGGEKHTDYKLYDVGTGGTFKTPTLRGISQRHQLMHDGCAKTLRDRFDPACGGSNHGDLSDLTADDLDDLTTYLKTL